MTPTRQLLTLSLFCVNLYLLMVIVEMTYASVYKLLVCMSPHMYALTELMKHISQFH